MTLVALIIESIIISPINTDALIIFKNSVPRAGINT